MDGPLIRVIGDERAVAGFIAVAAVARVLPVPVLTRRRVPAVDVEPQCR